MTYHYINLTNGIEAIKTLPPNTNFRFCRIQSTVCEQHLWDKLLLELSDDLLLNLALGHTCIIYDYGARKTVPRSIHTGVEFIRYVLNRRWFNRCCSPTIQRNDHTSVKVDHLFDHYYRNLSKNAKHKIDYFKHYLSTDTINLQTKTDATVHDGDYAYYRNILQERSKNACQNRP